MSGLGWALCVGWIAAALASAAWFGARARRAGALHRLRARLASPTVYLFTAYLVLAGFLTPHQADERVSPLYGLALALPVAYAAASFASAGAPRSRAVPLLLALLHGGAVLAAGAIVLALTSRRFVPPWLR